MNKNPPPPHPPTLLSSANKAATPAVTQSVQASVITVFLLRMFISFKKILSKTKSCPPVEFLCRGWALSEPAPSPSETPGGPSASQHPLVCSPVRFHPLALMIPLILFPPTLLLKPPFSPFSPPCVDVYFLSLCPSTPPNPETKSFFPIPVTSPLLPLRLI